MSEHKTPAEWAEAKGLYVLDPDGWRGADAPPWEQPISEAEFDDRASISTVGPLDHPIFARRPR